MLLVDLHGKGVIDDKVVKSNVINNQKFNSEYIKNLSQLKGNVEKPKKIKKFIFDSTNFRFYSRRP